MYSENPFSQRSDIVRLAESVMLLNERRERKFTEDEFRSYFNSSIRPQISASDIESEWKAMIKIFKQQKALPSNADKWEVPKG